MSSVVTREYGHVARPLKVLVPLIKEDLRKASEASQQAGMPYYKMAGEKLNEARDSGSMSVAEVTAWSKRNFGIGRSQTLLYMSYDDATSSLSGARKHGGHSTLSDFVRATGGTPRGAERGGAAWQEPIRENLYKAQRDAARLRDEELTRQEERVAEKKLALQLIDIGFKALASKLHPDKGGSRDAMSRLNRVRDRLKQHA